MIESALLVSYTMIVSINPPIIEYYTDTWYLDAEWIAGAAAGAFWPFYSQGPGTWHTIELAAMAERDGKLAFSQAKSRKLDVPWVNLTRTIIANARKIH